MSDSVSINSYSPKKTSGVSSTRGLLSDCENGWSARSSSWESGFQFSEQQKDDICSKLKNYLPIECSDNYMVGERKVYYFDIDTITEQANVTFGWGNWTNEIVPGSITMGTKRNAFGRNYICCRLVMRIILRDGTVREDIGTGSSEIFERDDGSAAADAQKKAVTDGMKRAFRLFGRRFNCPDYSKLGME